jgi:hypothetical protein
MNKTQIAKKFKVSNSLITDIVKKRRFTKNKNLALHIAAITGEKPLSYITPTVREAYKFAYPILKVRVQEEIMIVKKHLERAVAAGA